jgi:antitoxin HicB
MNILYPTKIKFSKSDQRYLVSFYDLEEAITEGETLQEALLNAAEVLTLTLAGRLDEEMTIPMPTDRTAKNVYYIAPSARLQAAILIRLSRGKHSIAKLARALDSSWPAISRLEDPHHWPSLRQLERAASALGQRLVLSMEPIATT